MNYIYDILINWKPQLYDFFEWNMEDDITHIRKIPVIKVDSTLLSEMREYSFKIDKNWMDKISFKTETFSNKKTNIAYACICCDGYEAIAFRFNQQGMVNGKSHLLIEEEAEVLEVSTLMEAETFTIEKSKLDKKEDFKTRREIETEKVLKKEIDKLVKTKQMDKLKYLYFECFDHMENREDVMLVQLMNVFKMNNYDMIEKMVEFFRLISIKQ